MLSITSANHVLLCAAPTDMRRSFDTLAGMVRQHLGNFDEVWKTMTIEEQCRLLRQLVERVGYDARGDKVKVTYNSNGISECCQKGAPK